MKGNWIHMVTLENIKTSVPRKLVDPSSCSHFVILMRSLRLTQRLLDSAEACYIRRLGFACMKEIGLWLSCLEHCWFFFSWKLIFFGMHSVLEPHSPHSLKCGSHFCQQATNSKAWTRSEKDIEWSNLCNHMQAELLHLCKISKPPFFFSFFLLLTWRSYCFLFVEKLWHSQFDLGCDKCIINLTKLNTESHKLQNEGKDGLRWQHTERRFGHQQRGVS